MDGTGSGTDDAVVVDARGLRCPLPVIRLAQAARALDAGSVLTLWSTDPAAEHDVPAWARMRGHTVENAAEHRGSGGTAYLATTVRLAARS
ncbi:sulfurtransferase TusA family protein [Sanguibacter sp. 25GB23B1]